MDPLAERYAAAALSGDVGLGTATAVAARDRHGVHWAIDHLVVPTQLQVGHEWERGHLAVVEERAASAVAVAVMTRLNTEVAAAVPAEAPVVALCCPRQEWHELPAMLVATHLWEAGFRVDELGPDTSVDGLSRVLHRRDVRAIMVSTTVSQALPGAGELFEVSRQFGVPTIAGGAAYGVDASRARYLGASAWLDDLRSVGAAVHSVDVAPDPSSSQLAARNELAVLAQRHDGLIRDLVQAAALEGVYSTDSPRGLSLIAEMVLRVVSAAVACDDPTVLTQALPWLSRMSLDEGVSNPGEIEVLRRVMLKAVERATPDLDSTRRVVRRTLLALATAPS